jgi:hypothetical protein
MPPVDFRKLGPPKRNPFAQRLRKDGYSLPDHEPSAQSLREMPPLDLSKATVRKNPYAERLRAYGYDLAVRPGRPRGGERKGPTVAKAVRLPPALWEEIQIRARAEGLSVHAFIRAVLLECLGGTK